MDENKPTIALDNRISQKNCTCGNSQFWPVFIDHLLLFSNNITLFCTNNIYVQYVCSQKTFKPDINWIWPQLLGTNAKLGLRCKACKMGIHNKCLDRVGQQRCMGKLVRYFLLYVNGVIFPSLCLFFYIWLLLEIERGTKQAI